MINNFQLMSVTDDIDERKSILMYMVINGKASNIAFTFPNDVKKDDLYRCFLIPAIESLLEQNYPDCI